MTEYIGAELTGPFVTTEYRLSYEGFLIPYVVAIRQNDGNFHLLVDGRMAFGNFSEEEIKNLSGVLAYAMSVAAGYSCFGENSVKDPNPFKVGFRGISLKPNLTIVKKEEK